MFSKKGQYLNFLDLIVLSGYNSLTITLKCTLKCIVNCIILMITLL